MGLVLVMSTLGISGVLILGDVTPAAACVCVSPARNADALTRSSAAFTGRLVKIEQPPVARPTNPDGSQMGAILSNVLTFRVGRVYKGEVHRSQEILTPSASSCGIELKRGERFLVFAWHPSTFDFMSAFRPGQYFTQQCSGTHEVSRAPRDLAPASEPKPGKSTSRDSFFPYGTLPDGDGYSCAQPFILDMAQLDRWVCVRVPKDGSVANERVYPPGLPR
jgi:hypothetical protein